MWETKPNKENENFSRFSGENISVFIWQTPRKLEILFVFHVCMMEMKGVCYSACGRHSSL
jgi:hypothetical protein